MPRRPLLALALLLVLTLPSALGRVLKEPSRASSPAPAPSAGAASASGPSAAPARMQPRIIGGTEDRSLRYFSYVARLRMDGYICTGSLIRPNVVLTAAHCLYPGDSTTKLATSRMVATIDGRDYAVVDAIHHEGYNPRADLNGERSGRRWADIALLFLASPASAPAVLLPAPAPFPIPAPSTSVHAAGYGRTQAGTTEGPTSDTLRYTDLTVYAHDQCRNFADTFCAGAADGHVTCGGDSGGPLTASTADNKQMLVGITSFGSADCSQPVSYFVRVQDYMGWINTNIGARQLADRLTS